MMFFKDFPFLVTALVGVNVVAAWELYLHYRQFKSYFCKKIPAFFKDILDEDEFKKNQAYGKDNEAFNIFTDLRDVLLTNICVLMRFSPKLYYWVAKRFDFTVGSFTHCYTYTIAEDVLSTLISLPFLYYDQFVIEERHGFNRMTRMEFVKDNIKSFLLKILIMHPIVIFLTRELVRWFGDQFPIYFFLCGVGITAVFTFIYPTLIQPLFNTYTPIPDDSLLYKKIMDLAKSHGFPLQKLYQVDGSRRSNHSNAYFYGFWKNKRIVLYDTLLKQMEEDDSLILAVLCHEMGHWKHNHTTIMFTVGIIQLFCISFSARKFIFDSRMYEEFGFRDKNPYIGFSIFSQFIAGPLLTFLSYFLSFVSRQFEFQADRYAVKSGYGLLLKKGLLIMHKENKSNVSPDSLYAALKYSHPPTAQRIAVIEEEIKKIE